MKILSMDELEDMYHRKGNLQTGDMEDLGITTMEIRAILLDDIADIVVDILRSHIYTDIYGIYEPHETYYYGRIPPGWVRVGTSYDRWPLYKYKRRFTLADEDNIDYKLIDGNTLFVTSNAEPNTSVNGTAWNSEGSGAFLHMLGTHPGAAWRGRFNRPAIEMAQEDIDNSATTRRKLTKAFNDGLARYMD